MSSNGISQEPDGKTTLESIKFDIQMGVCKRIYVSSRTLWWTHREEDLIQATKLGRLRQKIKFKTLLKGPTLSMEDKRRIKNLMDACKKAITPLDPDGAPLYINNDPMQFILDSEANAENYGRHGLAAFIKSHHKNSLQAFPDWESYNKLLDDENKNSPTDDPYDDDVDLRACTV